MSAKRGGLPADWIGTASEGGAVDKDRAAVVSNTLLQESDRGCAIFGAAILEDDLEALLRAFCRKDNGLAKQAVDPLFHTYAPLATFSAKVQLAYALGLITHDLKRKLDLVRRIRNDFAHEPGPMSFESPECQDRLRALIADGNPRVADANDDQRVPGLGSTTQRELVNRIAFILVIAVMSARIAFIREQAGEGKDPRLVVAKMEEDDR